MRWYPYTFALVALLLGLAGGGLRAEVRVYAAASLKTALDEVAAAYERETGDATTLVYAGSSALARQISFGAPADVFISANVDWMDWLSQQGRIVLSSRRDLLGNALVVISATHDGPPQVLGPDFDMLGVLGEDGFLTLALVDAVPAGIYARQALTHLGLWEAVSARVAQADNARAALALVALGEAPLGIVYATDAAAEPDVQVVATVPPEAHAPIRYPVALVEDARPEAASFVAFLAGPEARAIFEQSGFEWRVGGAP